MARYTAFLRGINVGGHRVSKAQLVEPFAGLGFVDVTTYLASGNVSFTTEELADQVLEERIERALAKALGFEAATFVRSCPELAAILAHEPFPNMEIGAGESLQIMFLKEAPKATARRSIAALSTERDELAVKGRELYWWSKGRTSDTTVDLKALTAIVSTVTTTRNANTIRKIAAGCP